MIKKQQSFADNSQLLDQVFDLLETSFPGITQQRDICKKWGIHWEAASTPFVIFQDRLAVSHVGVVALPFMISHQPVTAAGIHAVCTRPEYRRKGYFNRLMRDVLRYCAAHYETLILFTDQADLYKPFGFREIQEHRVKFNIESHLNLNQASLKNSKDIQSLRILDKKNPDDIRLIHRLLETRVSVSDVLGVWNEKIVFCFNEVSRPLYYIEPLDVILSMEIKGVGLHLYDLVGTQIFPLESILQYISGPCTEIYLYFSPDKLAGYAPDQSEAYRPEDSVLMVKGPFAAEESIFMVPRTGRF